MRSRLLWRRSATAVGIYTATILGFLGTLLAARALGPREFGLLAIVVSATAFFQSFLDVTAEEAVIKYGFRYTENGAWGKLRRLFQRALQVKVAGSVLGGLALVGLAPLARWIFGSDDLFWPLVISGLLPLVQAPEGLAGVAIVLRGRYDIRSWFLTVSMALRCLALGVGARYGVTEAVVAVVAGQAVASAAIAVAGVAAFRRFQAAPSQSLEEDRRSLLDFVRQSTLATTVLSLRGTFGPLLLGVVTSPLQVGFFRTAQAPQSALASLSAPVRLILLTEQTRDWERGQRETVFAGVRKYTLGAAALAAVVVPPLLVFMPDVIRVLFGRSYLPATDAARVLFVAGAIAVVIGWTKSLPVSIGRPGLRVVTHGIEAAVFIPLVLVFGAAWDAEGAAWAVLVSTCVFAAVWAVLLSHVSGSREEAREEAAAVEIEEALAP